MAESVDALVSNTSGATHPGSIPGLGTETEKVEKLSPFTFYTARNHTHAARIRGSTEHRSFNNFIANALGAITAYCFFEKKPAIDVEFVNDEQLSLF